MAADTQSWVLLPFCDSCQPKMHTAASKLTGISVASNGKGGVSSDVGGGTAGGSGGTGGGGASGGGGGSQGDGGGGGGSKGDGGGGGGGKGEGGGDGGSPGDGGGSGGAPGGAGGGHMPQLAGHSCWMSQLYWWLKQPSNFWRKEQDSGPSKSSLKLVTFKSTPHGEDISALRWST